MKRSVQWAAGKFQLRMSAADMRSPHQRPRIIPEGPWSKLSWWQYIGLYCNKGSRCSLSVLSKQKCMIAHLLLTDEGVWDTAQVGCSSAEVYLQSLQSRWVWTLSGAEPGLHLLGWEWLEYICLHRWEHLELSSGLPWCQQDGRAGCGGTQAGLVWAGTDWVYYSHSHAVLA